MCQRIAPAIEPRDLPRVDPGDLARRRSGGHEAVDAWWGVPGGRGRGRGAVARRGADAAFVSSTRPVSGRAPRTRRDDRAGGTVTFSVPDRLGPPTTSSIDGTRRHPGPACQVNGGSIGLPMPPALPRLERAHARSRAGAAYRLRLRLHAPPLDGGAGSPSERLRPRRPGGTPGGTPPGAHAAGGGTPPPGGGTPTQPGGTTTPGLAATSLKLAKRQTGSRLRGSVDVRERGSRLRVDALVRRTALGQRRSGRVRVGRLVRSSVGPGRVAFSLGLQAKARKVLRARRKLAVQAADHRHPPRRQPAHVDTQRDARRALRRDTAPA